MGCHYSSQYEKKSGATVPAERKSEATVPAEHKSANIKSFLIAADTGNLTTLKKILESNEVDINFNGYIHINKYFSNDDHNSALGYCCMKGHYDSVEYLLRKNADINIQNKMGFTPLMFSVIGNFLGIGCLLIQNNCDLERKNNEGNNALHLSCYKNYINFISLFINNGFNLESKNLNGDTPLLISCKSRNKVVSLLLVENGANPKSRNNSGKSALDYAKKYNFGEKILETERKYLYDKKKFDEMSESFLY